VSEEVSIKFSPFVFANRNKPEPIKEKEVQAWVYDDELKEFAKLEKEKFLSMPIRAFADSALRFVIKFKSDNSIVRIVSNDNDYWLIRQKYPKHIVVKAEQLMHLWSKNPSAEDILSVLLPCSILNASVVPTASFPNTFVTEE